MLTTTSCPPLRSFLTTTMILSHGHQQNQTMLSKDEERFVRDDGDGLRLTTSVVCWVVQWELLDFNFKDEESANDLQRSFYSIWILVEPSMYSALLLLHMSHSLIFIPSVPLISYPISSDCKTHTKSLPFRSIGESAIWISANIFASCGSQSAGEIQQRNYVKFNEFASWYNNVGFAVRVCVCLCVIEIIDCSPHFWESSQGCCCVCISSLIILFSTLGCHVAGDA